jgi:molybdopterin biosynthesis enzyme
VGVRDLTAEVFSSFEGAKLLVHGVGVSPGKPFIWVKAGDKQLLGLPGQVASCLISFYLFVEPVMERLLGRDPSPLPALAARRRSCAARCPRCRGARNMCAHGCLLKKAR